MKKSVYWYILIVPLYTLAFFVAESVVTEGRFISYLPVDDYIPFIEAFVVPYVAWYPLLFGVGIFLLIKDEEVFKRYMTFIGISFFSIIILNVIFPNAQELRPEVMPRDNVFTDLVSAIYKADTNTNVIPSMHVVGAIGASVACLYSKKFSTPWRVVILTVAVLTSLSTVFIKQHSILDGIVALPYGAITSFISFRRKARS